MKTRSSAARSGLTSKREKSQLKFSSSAVYPFSGIVGQDEMKLALILNVIDPSIGGVLMMGHRGTGKTTVVRALAKLLPDIRAVPNCPYRCDPWDRKDLCAQCGQEIASGQKLQRQRAPVTVVDLPLGATEDRVCGTIDIERALNEGVKAFEPGLLARANRGFLYIDEVNLLDDHLVDLLLDVAATGVNTVERESISVQHPARFVLIGSGNPEEGELRPQLLDRFGVFVEVRTENDLQTRVKIVERREAFDRDPEAFCAVLSTQEEQLRRKISKARKNFRNVKVPRELLQRTAQLSAELSVDGHRGELTITRAARALAAFEARRSITADDVRRVAIMSLRHRLRRDALEETAASARVEQALEKVFPKAQRKRRRSRGDGDGGESDRSQNAGGRGAHHSAAAARHLAESPLGKLGGGRATALLPPAWHGKTPEFRLDQVPRMTRGQSKSARRHNGRKCVSHNDHSGRYSRAVTFKRAGSRVAVDATLRAEAGMGVGRQVSEWVSGAGCQVPVNHLVDTQHLTPGTRYPRLGTHYLEPDTRHPIPVGALRFKQFSRRSGKLFIFAIDASGSMALNRINRARSVLLGLLQRSYINRDRVAIIAFRDKTAEVLLSPSRSMLRAQRVLDSLRIGGGTPLSAGLACALELARRDSASGAGEIVLLLFTDGRANVPLKSIAIRDRLERWQIIQDELGSFGTQLRKAGVTTAIVETQNGFVSAGEARSLAKHLGVRYVEIKSFG
jgi:magnesium chelatase ATPase subunit I